MGQTTIEDFRRWYDDGQEQSATHMLIVCDTFDYEDFPVYVQSADDVTTVVHEEQAKSMQSIHEVWSMALPFDQQFAEVKTWHLEPVVPQTPVKQPWRTPLLRHLDGGGVGRIEYLQVTEADPTLSISGIFEFQSTNKARQFASLLYEIGYRENQFYRDDKYITFRNRAVLLQISPRQAYRVLHFVETQEVDAN